jgi:hypothetical protein
MSRRDSHDFRTGLRDQGKAPELEVVPVGSQIVHPAKQTQTSLAWRDGRWMPVHRERGIGWVWGK